MNNNELYDEAVEALITASIDWHNAALHYAKIPEVMPAHYEHDVLKAASEVKRLSWRDESPNPVANSGASK